MKKEEVMQEQLTQELGFLNLVEEWLWELDARFIFTYSNNHVQEILGYRPEELIGKSLFAFVDPKDHEKAKQTLQESIQKKRLWSCRLLWQHRNKTMQHLKSRGEPFFDSQGELKGFRGIEYNLTPQINLEEAKNEFLSIASHELRTPLTSIYGALGLLTKEKVTPQEQKELLTLALRNAQQLIEIIENILSVARQDIDDHHTPLYPVYLNEIAQKAIEQMSIEAERRGISLIGIGLEQPAMVQGEEKKLFRVLFNLLSNALKFSPTKKLVTVSLAVDKNCVKLAVHDRGKGIPQAFHPKIFTRFAQAESGNNRSIEGAGLGLSACKEILESLGGSIGFSCNEKEGTTFFFELPLVKKSTGVK